MTQPNRMGHYINIKNKQADILWFPKQMSGVGAEIEKSSTDGKETMKRFVMMSSVSACRNNVKIENVITKCEMSSDTKLPDDLLVSFISQLQSRHSERQWTNSGAHYGQSLENPSHKKTFWSDQIKGL